MEHQAVSLATKPGASLHISTLFPDPPDRPNGSLENTFLVFLNGLMLPREGWFEAIDQLIKNRNHAGRPLPALLSYDRYGQGDSDPDPNDPPGTAYGHDAKVVIADLHQLLEQVSRHYLGKPIRDLAIVFVCNSIGCPLARLYAAEHPGSVSAMLFLDSMMAHTDFVSLFPDPDDFDFDTGKLPRDVSIRDIQHARERFGQFFHPTVANPEHFDRRNLSQLLPHADRPNLPPAPGGHSACLIVVGHDPDEFARQSEEGSLSVPSAVINAYVNPAWTEYNKGLTRLVGHRHGQPKVHVKIAKGCGHFIQKDNPVLVANEISNLLDLLCETQLDIWALDQRGPWCVSWVTRRYSEDTVAADQEHG